MSSRAPEGWDEVFRGPCVEADLIRAILEVRRDEVTRPVMQATLTKALSEREKIRRAGWMN